MTDWFTYELLNLPTSGQDSSPPRTGAQPVPDWFIDDPPDMPYMMDMVAHLQLEVEVLNCVQSRPSTSATKALLVQAKPAVFTSTKVPKFSGVTSINKCLTLLYGRMGGMMLRSLYNSCPTWRGRIECRPVGAGGKKGHAGRISRGPNITLWITGPVGRLSTPVREDSSARRGGPFDIRNSLGSTCG